MDRLDVTALTFDELVKREWLAANGIGGFASSTVCGLNTRKYHGLLVAAMTQMCIRDRLRSDAIKYSENRGNQMRILRVMGGTILLPATTAAGVSRGRVRGFCGWRRV